MQRDLRGQREAASGDLSERAARKDTGHGITFFRICTFTYRVREISTAFFRTPCGSFICWGVAPKPQRGLRPLNTALHSAEIARLLAVFPSLTQCVKLQSQFELIAWGFTPNPLSGQCPQPYLLSIAIIYTIPSERKTYTNTIQFKNF